MALYPCRNCKYFKECGNTNRTVPCNGREIKGKRKRIKNGKGLWKM